jgi:hypothetical protein
MASIKTTRGAVRGVLCGGSGAGPHAGNRHFHAQSRRGDVWECAGCGRTANRETMIAAQARDPAVGHGECADGTGDWII